MHVKKPRDKLRGGSGWQIKTIYGVGYKEDIKRILGGEVLVKRKVFFHPLNIYVVMAGLPVREGSGTAGVVFLFSPFRELREAQAQAYRIIWLTALALLFPATALVFFVSRHMARPVERIQRAAAALAESHFGEDLPVTGRDELARLTATFNYMKNRLKQVEEMRREFLAAVSHELCTPLTSVRGFIQAILEGLVVPAEQEKYLRRAYGEAERLGRLVGDLLKLARLRAGGVRLRRERVGMGGVWWRKCWRIARLLPGRRGCPCMRSCPQGKSWFRWTGIE